MEEGLAHCLHLHWNSETAGDSTRVLSILSQWNPLLTDSWSSSGQSHAHPALCTSAHVIPWFSRLFSVLVCWASTQHQCLLLCPLLERIHLFFLTKVQMWLQGQTGSMDQLVPGMVAWLTQQNLLRGLLHSQVTLCDPMLWSNAHLQFHDSSLLYFRSWQQTKSIW